VKISVTTRGITVDPGDAGHSNTTGAIVALCSRCWGGCVVILLYSVVRCFIYLWL
jgi:hypothetical protein